VCGVVTTGAVARLVATDHDEPNRAGGRPGTIVPDGTITAYGTYSIEPDVRVVGAAIRLGGRGRRTREMRRPKALS